jgi:hypothetical protein
MMALTENNDMLGAILRVVEARKLLFLKVGGYDFLRWSNVEAQMLSESYLPKAQQSLAPRKQTIHKVEQLSKV